MTSEESILYNDLKKLVKRANQRIVRLERLVESQGEFATKQLYDHLESEVLQAKTKQGRIKLTGLNQAQMEAVKQAVEEFLTDPLSTTGKIKEYKRKIEKRLGTKITYVELSAMYKARELWKWSDDEYGSTFWTDFAPRIFTENKKTWVNFASKYTETNDEDVKEKLRRIYDYIKEHGLRGVVKFD